VVRSKKKEWRSICNEANETKNTMGKEWLGWCSPLGELRHLYDSADRHT
jgi:hypothetical protein